MLLQLLPYLNLWCIRLYIHIIIVVFAPLSLISQTRGLTKATKEDKKALGGAHLVIPRADEVLDDVAARSIAARVAEPLARFHATHDTRRVVDAAETTGPFRSLNVCHAR